jgi:spore coat protein CotH
MFMSSDGGFFNPPPIEDDFTPIFSKASVFFNGTEWYHVGVRFKGNSSLRTTWQQGIMKLAFRLDFDEFEDDYPEIKNQRFYGFQKISLSNNFEDNSFLHEKVAADIFRNAGLKSPNTAYYAIYVDYGEGPVYFGLYTGVEIVEDTMLDDQFGSDDGNCYKPEGNAATFAYGTFNESEFDLKTNEDIADYSDVKALYEIINSSLRLSDTVRWKNNLESVFDVDNFLNWLAVNTVIQNWDTYGLMNHNYYLYHNPYTDKLVWIPWDNNEALTEGKMGNLSFSMSEVTSAWPLIRYLLDQDEYKTRYENYMQQTIEGAFKPSDIKEIYQYYHNLISEYVETEQDGYSFLNSISDFTNSLNEQNNHVDDRYDAVNQYLTK